MQPLCCYVAGLSQGFPQRPIIFTFRILELKNRKRVRSDHSFDQIEISCMNFEKVMKILFYFMIKSSTSVDRNHRVLKVLKYDCNKTTACLKILCAKDSFSWLCRQRSIKEPNCNEKRQIPSKSWNSVNGNSPMCLIKSYPRNSNRRGRLLLLWLN